jgi:hypothetical protein
VADGLAGDEAKPPRATNIAPNAAIFDSGFIPQGPPDGEKLEPFRVVNGKTASSIALGNLAPRPAIE